MSKQAPSPGYASGDWQRSQEQRRQERGTPGRIDEHRPSATRKFGENKPKTKGLSQREDTKRRGRPEGREQDSLSRRDDYTGTFRVKKKKEAVFKVVKKVSPDVFIPSVVSVGNLAKLLNIRLDRLQHKMVQVGMKAESSYDYILNAEYASLIAMEFNRNPVVNDEAAFDIFAPPECTDRSALPVRPPVVTIMGHVDHGKTTLLDTLRSTSVAAGEAGGITQHIGAFSVDVPNQDPSSSTSHRSITFLDTPGHAAFSAMRARGASVTDVVVLVVAADDGIMPQTREVLELVRKEQDNVALIVAINKMDKPGVDAEEIEKALLAEDVQLETFGGDVPVVHVSGLTGQGLPQLVETISLVAEMRDLRAEDSGTVQGYVLESKVDKGLGPVATVLIRRGQLTPATHLVCGTTHCKVRLLTSPHGTSVKTVGPGAAVVVTGWKDVPNAGEEVISGSESDIKRAISNRLRKAELEATLKDLDSINETRRTEREARETEGQEEQTQKPVEETKKELKLMIKGDVSGTVEAVAGSLQGIGNHLTGVKIIATGVGPVTESDVMRAKASEATIVAFSVKTPRPVQSEAKVQEVPIIESDIIYRLMDEIKDRVLKLLPPLIETRVSGEATVMQLFEIKLKAKQVKKIAGCSVINGAINKTRKARVVRDGKTIHSGTIETLKHLKADMTEVSKGLECGIAFAGWDELQPGDVVQVFQEVEAVRTL
ncbi:initiation factor 2 [Cytidiella melzeri]|nr:initiation factor 2 [Cytidiella melzeri]